MSIKKKKNKTPSPVNAIARANKIHLSPRNSTQRIYLESLEINPQTFVLGPAGTGKTFLAAAFAAKSYLKGDINKIIITRPRVEVDEEWGALPGGLDKKTAPWAYPVIEILEEYIGKAQLAEAQKRGDIEVLPLAFMRGRTLQNCMCILDEAQNTTVNQMKMFVTRIGENSRVVINGDIAQTDLKAASGLAWALQMLRTHDYLPAELVEFGPDEVERSKECAAWIKAMSESPCPK